jgi:hypothetical protein
MPELSVAVCVIASLGRRQPCASNGPASDALGALLSSSVIRVLYTTIVASGSPPYDVGQPPMMSPPQVTCYRSWLVTSR